MGRWERDSPGFRGIYQEFIGNLSGTRTPKKPHKFPIYARESKGKRDGGQEEGKRGGVEGGALRGDGFQVIVVLRQMRFLPGGGWMEGMRGMDGRRESGGTREEGGWG